MLSFKNVSKKYKTYDGEKIVFDHFNFMVGSEDFISVIGTNGAGKSTLVKLLVGDECVDSGEILLNGESIETLPAFKRKRRIAKVYQDPSRGTAGNMTILENMALADHKGKKYGLSRGVSKERIPHYKKLLASLRLGLEDQLQTEVSALSGGQRQALALLMVAMNPPEILVLDEHTSALDPKTAKVVMEKTREIVKEYKIPTLMITHNMETALKYGNRLIKLNAGKVEKDLDLTGGQEIDKEELF